MNLKEFIRLKLTNSCVCGFRFGLIDYPRVVKYNMNSIKACIGVVSPSENADLFIPALTYLKGL